eukprot:468437_1
MRLTFSNISNVCFGNRFVLSLVTSSRSVSSICHCHRNNILLTLYRFFQMVKSSKTEKMSEPTLPTKWQVGQRVEAFISKIKQWIPATIVYVSNGKVCVECDSNFTHFVDYKCVWVKNTPQQLSPIYTHYPSTSPLYNPLRRNLLIFNSDMSKPLYYKSRDGKNIILMRNYDKNTDGHCITLYDINQRTETKFFLFPNMEHDLHESRENHCITLYDSRRTNHQRTETEFSEQLFDILHNSFATHTNTLHMKNNMLYSFNNTRNYTTLDMISKECNECIYTCAHVKYLTDPNILYVPSVNKIHIIDQFAHYNFNEATRELIHIANIEDAVKKKVKSIISWKTIWIESMKSIFLFSITDIYYCKIDNMQTEYKWKKFEIVLKHKTNDYNILCVSDNVIMIYYRD